MRPSAWRHQLCTRCRHAVFEALQFLGPGGPMRRLAIAGVRDATVKITTRRVYVWARDAPGRQLDRAKGDASGLLQGTGTSNWGDQRCMSPQGKRGQPESHMCFMVRVDLLFYEDGLF